MQKILGSIFVLGIFINAFAVKASSLIATQSLSFGTLIPLTSSGSVSVSMSGALTTGGSVTVAPSGTGYYQGLMNFHATGLSAVVEVVTVSVLDNSVVLNNSRSGGGTVTVSNFVTNNSLTVSLLNPNINNIPLGGTMSFTSASKGGTYTGSVRVRTTGLLSGTTNATVPITLTLWNALSVNQVSELNFGSIERLTGNSVVRLNPATSQRTVVSGASGINLVSAPASTAGQFGISGEPNVNISITLPSSVTLIGSNGGSMTVNNFTASPSSTATSLDNNGNRTLLVGADLNIGANQTAGTYSGTYNLTINY